jgi:hypothetical protein
MFSRVSLSERRLDNLGYLAIEVLEHPVILVRFK